MRDDNDAGGSILAVGILCLLGGSGYGEFVFPVIVNVIVLAFAVLFRVACYLIIPAVGLVGLLLSVGWWQLLGERPLNRKWWDASTGIGFGLALFVGAMSLALLCGAVSGLVLLFLGLTDYVGSWWIQYIFTPLEVAVVIALWAGSKTVASKATRFKMLHCAAFFLSYYGACGALAWGMSQLPPSGPGVSEQYVWTVLTAKVLAVLFGLASPSNVDSPVADELMNSPKLDAGCPGEA